MTEGTDTPTITQGADTPAEVETSKPAETPVNETAKTEEAASPDVETSEAEETESEKPKRVSGYDRMKRKNQYLQSEILRLQELASKNTQEETDKAPREEDFNGDWGKFIAASAAYEAAKAVKDSLKADKNAANQSRVAELRSEVLADFEERAEEFKAKATDFDEVVSNYVQNGGKFSDAVRELVTESDLGPQLTYHLAKHQALANKINSLPPLQAAKEIARLEDTLSRPPKKQKTEARPPIPPLGGGAAAPASSLTDLAKSDNVEAYAAMRRKQREARA